MQMTKASGAYFLMPAPTCSMTWRLMPEQVVAAHAGLARHAGGDDHHVGTGDRLIGDARRSDAPSKPSTRAMPAAMIERLALRNAVGDVEHHDVAEFLEAGEKGEGSADLTGTDQGNLGYEPWEGSPLSPERLWTRKC